MNVNVKDVSMSNKNEIDVGITNGPSTKKSGSICV